MTAPASAPVDVVAAARHAEDLGFESVWVVDQLVAGTGAPLARQHVALAAAAAATERIRSAYGVVIVPLRPVAWLAKQVATLQHLSGGRVLLGVGVGGDRHDRSWAAAGVSRRERGQRTDAALAVLPDLVAGKPAAVPDVGRQPRWSSSPPGAAVPPILVGGTVGRPAAPGTVATATGGSRCPVRRRGRRPSHRLAQLAADAGRADAGDDRQHHRRHRRRPVAAVRSRRGRRGVTDPDGASVCRPRASRRPGHRHPRGGRPRRRLGRPGAERVVSPSPPATGTARPSSSPAALLA